MSWYAVLKRSLRQLVFCVPVTIAFVDHVGYIAKVDGMSMQPTLNPEDQTYNDYVLLNRWAVRNFDINHGDVVILSCPKNPSTKLIKRIIALQGDTIRHAKRRRKFIHIPVGSCWVEGDNVSNSYDSNNFGSVATGLIIAKASYIVWPPSRFQRLESYMPKNRAPIFYAETDPSHSWTMPDYKS